MSLEIVRYEESHVEGVRQFNRRIVTGGEGVYQLPTDLRHFEESARSPIPTECWLAIQDGVVRGGYLLRWQNFSFFGEIHKIAFYYLSVSEGAIDRKYASISISMVREVTTKAPLIFALGMGSVNARLPRFLHAFKWTLHEIPFVFRAVRPGSVVRNIPTIRTTRLRRILFDLAARTGAAGVGVGIMQRSRRRGVQRNPEMRYEVVSDFGPWADVVWNACAGSFAMIGVRDSRALNALYPAEMPRISRLRVSHRGSVIGWAVVRNSQMKKHKQFGNLHVGTIVDCLSLHQNAPLVSEAADEFLENRDVDLIVSNQSNECWKRALVHRGFLEGPSNYVIAASDGVRKLLEPFDRNRFQIHITRGDGHGYIHL